MPEDNLVVIRQPDLFRGDDGESFEEWLHRFDAVATANSWKPEDQLKILPSCLGRPAFEKWRKLEAGQKDTYPHLTEHLKTALLPKDDQMVWSLKFRKAEKRSEESLEGFVTRLKKWAGLAFPGTDDAHQAARVQEQFILGQTTALQFHLLNLEDGKTLEDYLKAAKRFEVATDISNMGMTRNKISNVQENDSVNTLQNPSSSDQRSLAGAINYPIIEKPSSSRNRCYGCGEFGHLAKHCRQHSSKGVICYNCQDIGHLARNCKQKKTRPKGSTSLHCFKCGRDDHVASYCRESNEGGVKSAICPSSEKCSRCLTYGHAEDSCWVTLREMQQESRGATVAVAKNELVPLSEGSQWDLEQ